MIKNIYFKKYIKKIILILYYPILKSQLNELTYKFFDLYEKKDFSSKKSFFTYHIRPKKDIYKKSIFEPKKGYTNNDLGIIIQGGIISEDDFTIETVKYYKKINPNLNIVVSTWDDEDEYLLNELKNSGADIITSSKPKVKGFGNINLQILSTRRGIEYLEKSGVKYIVKTRTDQRIYYEGFIDYFINLLKLFPVSSHSKNQNERIIVLNIGTCVDIPFLITDMMQFGYIEDMKKMWFIPLSNKNINRQTLTRKTFSVSDLKNANASELYIIENFLKNLGANYEFSYNNHLDILKSRFVVVDQSNINLFWYKYSANEFFYIDYEKSNRFVRLNFSDWLNLYNSESNLYDIDDQIINVKF